MFLGGDVGSSVSNDWRKRVVVQVRGTSPPESADGAMQRLDGGYDTFLDEKRASVSCVLFLY